MVWTSLSLVGVSLAISLPLAAVLVYLGQRWSLMDEVGAEAHKAHARAVPNTGGIAIFAAVAAPLTLALAAVWALPIEQWTRWAPAVAVHVPGLRDVTELAVAVLAAMAVLHAVGIIDDRRALGPGIKLAAQLTVAVGLTWAGFRVLEFMQRDFGWWGAALSFMVTIVWFIVIINAFNFLDNMDGLSGGVGAIIAALYLAATLIGQQWFVAALAALLVGALLGFLAFNVPPARLFMGDSGSLVIGLLLAVISVRTTYFDPAPAMVTGALESAPQRNWYGILMPVMVMAIPLYDFTSVTLIRLSQGRSPFRGDQQHFSHRLVELGLSRRRAVGVIWLCTLATGLAGVMLGSLAVWQALIAAAQTVAVVMLLAVLEHGARRRG